MARRTIQPEETTGLNFRDLLSSAVGKEFSQIDSNDVKEWATAQGYRKKDINRITKGFSKFSKKNTDFTLTNPGEFEVSGAGLSGKRTGNVKGFDIGDLIGLGRDVSTFAGALEQSQDQSQDVVKDFDPSLSTTADKEALTAGFSKPIDLDGSANINAQAQRKRQSDKDASPKQRPVIEGKGELALGPDESFDFSNDLSPFVQREGLGLLNIDQNDFGGNVKLGDRQSKSEEKSAPSAGITVSGLLGRYEKDDKGIYEVVQKPDGSFVKGEYIDRKKKPGTYQQILKAYSNRDKDTLSDKATEFIQSVPDRLQSFRESAQDVLFRKSIPLQRNGGKITKFSR